MLGFDFELNQLSALILHPNPGSEKGIRQVLV